MCPRPTEQSCVPRWSRTSTPRWTDRPLPPTATSAARPPTDWPSSIASPYPSAPTTPPDRPAPGSSPTSTLWLDPGPCSTTSNRCFTYDRSSRGVVGRIPSFGSELFNDHHFHYGYFLAAAALVADLDPSLVDDWRPTLDALADDIAAPYASGDGPALRTFDPYAGHSWASGLSPFADGNNQESSSEAVNAWNGLALWAQVAGDDERARQAAWQLSVESATAAAYWLQPSRLPAGYATPSCR